MKKHLILSAVCMCALQLQAQAYLKLDDVRELALKHNLHILTANNAVEQAEEQKKSAFTSYFPQVSAVGFGMRTNKELVQAEIKPGELLPADLAQALPAEMVAAIPQSIPVSAVDRTLIAGVAAVQPVFVGGQIVNGNRLAQVGGEVSKLQLRNARNQVSLAAEQYYWQIVSLKEKRKTLEAVSGMLDNYRKDADVAVKAGVGMQNDLLAVKLKQNEVESARIKLENGLKLAKRALAQYIGMEGQEIDVMADIDPSVMPDCPILDANADSAVYNTVEYQLLKKNLEAAKLQRKMEIGKHLPAVAVGAGYNYMDLGRGVDNDFGMLFATLKVPITDWWGGSHNVRRLKLAEDNAEYMLNDNTQLLKIRVQKSTDDVNDAYLQLVLAQKSIEQSEENLRLNKDYYHAGTVSMNDLLDAEQKYQQARDQYTDAYAALQTKIVEYRQCIGFDK